MGSMLLGLDMLGIPKISGLPKTWGVKECANVDPESNHALSLTTSDKTANCSLEQMKPCRT